MTAKIILGVSDDCQHETKLNLRACHFHSTNMYKTFHVRKKNVWNLGCTATPFRHMHKITYLISNEL